MSFSSNLALWLGVAPNALQSGRVDCYVGVNNDKTGYSLTAGSYVVRASAKQHVDVAIAGGAVTGTASVSAVTDARAYLTGTGTAAQAATAIESVIAHMKLTSTTVITARRGGSASTCEGVADLLEIF